MVSNRQDQDFSILDESNWEIFEDLPPNTRGYNRIAEEIFQFFEKIPIGKVYRVKFPNKKLRDTYAQRLRFYASQYIHKAHFQIIARMNDKGYYVFLKKMTKEERDKYGKENLEK